VHEVAQIRWERAIAARFDVCNDPRPALWTGELGNPQTGFAGWALSNWLRIHEFNSLIEELNRSITFVNDKIEKLNRSGSG